MTLKKALQKELARGERERGNRRMVTLEEQSLTKMVHEFFESESPTTPNSLMSSSSSSSSFHQQSCFILEEILGSSTDAEMDVYEKALMHLGEIVDQKKKNSSVKKILMIRLRKDGYDASICRSSWVSTVECPGGNYEYIAIVTEEDSKGGSTRLIVDIDFSSQFELARPTPAYTHLCSTLPCIFVGSEEKLKRVVSLLCSAAQQSLRESGLHIPPWRKPMYMLSKWLSCCHKASHMPSPNYVPNRVGVEKAAGKADVPKKRAKGSGLSSQFSNLSIDCC